MNKKLPCITGSDSTYVLLKDYQDFNGWIVMIISKSDTFTKADKRIKGDIKMATKKFQEIYLYNGTVEQKSLKEIIEF